MLVEVHVGVMVKVITGVLVQVGVPGVQVKDKVFVGVSMGVWVVVNEGLFVGESVGVNVAVPVEVGTAV